MVYPTSNWADTCAVLAGEAGTIGEFNKLFDSAKSSTSRRDLVRASLHGKQLALACEDVTRLRNYISGKLHIFMTRLNCR